MLKTICDRASWRGLPFDLDRLEAIINEIASARFKIKTDFYYDLVLLTPGKMLRLNKATRGRNYVADVITVSFYEVRGNAKNVPARFVTRLLGEIYLCPRRIEANARKHGVAYLSEFSRMWIHGIMHLLDFDHEKSRLIEYLTLTIQDEINARVLRQYRRNEKE